MRYGPKRLSGLVAVTAAALLVVAACGTSKSSNTSTSDATFATCDQNPNTCNSGTAKQGGTVVATSEKPVYGWNVNDANANTFDITQMLAGVLPGAFIVNPDFSITPNNDLLDSATQTSTSPQTIVYKIKQAAVWSDGSPIDASDFTWAWKTENGNAADCPPDQCAAASTSGYTQIDNVVGSDNNKTVTVTFKTPFSDWKSLFGILYPAHIAAGHGATLGAQWKWFNDNVPSYSGGPYQIDANGYVKDASLTLVPNPKWYGAVKPSLDKLVYKIITDQTAEVPALQNGEVNEIYPQPNRDMVTQVKGLPNTKYRLGKGLIWEHLDLNLKSKGLGDLAVRQAIFTAVDRKQIIARTIGTFVDGVVPLGSHNFVPGQQGYQDFVTSTGQGSGDGAKATQILTGAGYTITGGVLKDKTGAAVPPLRIVYTTGNTNRQATAELIQSELAPLGIKVNITPTTDLGGTLGTGNYDIIIFAWVGGPFVGAGAQQLWTIKGGGDYNNFSDPTVDTDLAQAAVTTDPTQELSLVNQADQILTNAAVVLPLYQKPTFLAVNSNLIGIRDNPTSAGPAYNVQYWGLTNTPQ